MTAKGNPYDKAKHPEGTRSFFKTLKREEVERSDYRTVEEAAVNIGHFIDDAYNRKRLHSSPGYVPPAEFEAAYRRAAAVDPARGSLPGVHSIRPSRPM